MNPGILKSRKLGNICLSKCISGEEYESWEPSQGSIWLVLKTCKILGIPFKFVQFPNIRKVSKFPPKYSLRNRDGLSAFTSCLNIQELSTFKRFHSNLRCLTNSKFCLLKEEDNFCYYLFTLSVIAFWYIQFQF